MEKTKGSFLSYGAYLLRLLYFVVAIGDYMVLFTEVVKTTLKRPPSLKLILKQLYDIGVSSLIVVGITGFFTGLVIAAQSFYQLADKGLTGVTGIMVGKAMMTELGPVLTAFMVTGRVGAAMCAELGTMKVTEQVEALESMAVSPNRYLIAPRLIAGIVMMPMLTLFSIVLGIWGGYLISIYFFDMAPANYLEPMRFQLTMFDAFLGLFKAFIFGVLIMTICCYKGIKATGGAEGVGKAITSSVVITYVFILCTNFMLTMALNIFREELFWFL